MSTPTSVMPFPGQKGAPSKFKGDYEQVRRFLKHFNQLCKTHGITDAKDKCNAIVDYCSSKVNRLIEALASYRANDWDKLEKDLL
jgi:hypothetical protein